MSKPDLSCHCSERHEHLRRSLEGISQAINTANILSITGIMPSNQLNQLKYFGLMVLSLHWINYQCICFHAVLSPCITFQSQPKSYLNPTLKLTQTPRHPYTALAWNFLIFSLQSLISQWHETFYYPFTIWSFFIFFSIYITLKSLQFATSPFLMKNE